MFQSIVEVSVVLLNHESNVTRSFLYLAGKKAIKVRVVPDPAVKTNLFCYI